MQHLQDQQQGVEEPPGGVGPDDVPALKQRAVQDPAMATGTGGMDGRTDQ